MNQHQFLKEYREYLTENSDPIRAEKEKAYLYSDLNHYGLSSPVQKKFVSNHRKWLKQLHKDEMIDLAMTLWGAPSHEERSMALSVINIQKEKLDTSDMPMIERIMRESRGWALLDGSIIPFMPIILEKNPSTYDYLRKWIKDNDFWVRRSALLAQLLFFRYDNGGNRELFFRLANSQYNESWIEEVYTDREDIKRARFFIRKAIGWVLREMSAKQPKVVFSYIKEQKDEMSGLTFREGSRKLPSDMQKRLQ